MQPKSEPKQKKDSDQNEERVSEQSQEEDSTQNREEDDKEKKNPRETAQSFYAIAALSSTWLPCVVGDQNLRIFLVSGVTSRITKVLFLGLAVSLAGSGLQPHIYKRPFLLFCCVSIILSRFNRRSQNGPSKNENLK